MGFPRGWCWQGQSCRSLSCPPGESAASRFARARKRRLRAALLALGRGCPLRARLAHGVPQQHRVSPAWLAGAGR